MPYDFKYIPTSGALSGPAFISQTEQAINEVGSNNEDALQLAEEARDLADNALSTSYEALGTAQQALTEAQKGKDAADQAMLAAQTAQRTADQALDDAASAQSTADTALSKAEGAQSTAEEAQGTADAALATASLADTKAQIAQKTADKAQEGLDALKEDVTDLREQVADNAYRINRALVYLEPDSRAGLDEYVEESLNLYIRDETTPGLPLPGPGYLTVRVDDAEDMVVQSFQALSGETYRRTCALYHEIPHPGTEDLTFSLAAEGIEFASGTLSAQSADGVLTIDFQPGGFETEANDDEEVDQGANWGQNSFQGWIKLPLAGNESASLLIDGQLVADFEDEDFTIVLHELETGKGLVHVQDAEVDGDSLRVLIHYDWTDVEELITRWSDWSKLAIRRDESLILDADGRLGVAPYDLVTSLEGVANVTIDKSTPASLSLNCSESLSIRAADLGDACDKLTTLAITADTATSLLWLFDGDQMLWISEETVLSIAAGNTAIVNVWQVAGKCLLSTVYVDEPESQKLGLEIKQAGSEFVLRGFNRQSCTADTVIRWGDGHTTSYADLPESGDCAHVYAEEGEFVVSYFASKASFKLSGNSCLVSVTGALPQSFAEPDLAAMFSECTSLKEVDTEVFSYQERATSLKDCFNGCSSLPLIPVGLFDPLNKISTIESCFKNCKGLTQVTHPVLKNSSARTWDSCFSGCEALAVLTPDIFSGQGNCSLTHCFEKCSSLVEIPSGFLSLMGDITRTLGLFSGCSSLVSIPSDLFQYQKHSNINAIFSDCTSLETVPEDLFQSCSSITSLHMVFYGCTKLKHIPENLFASMTNVTAISDLFMHCSSLDTVPESIFNSMVNIENTNRTFCGSGITSIPSKLFKNNKNIKTARLCFSETLLSRLPDFLFNDCIYLEDVSSLCADCSELEHTGIEIFENTPLLSDASRLFNNCKKLSVIDEKLLNQSPNIKNGGSIFSGCSSLVEIPEGIFENNTLITDFRSTFYGCRALLSKVPKLWERENVVHHDKCFSNCTNAANYDDIPDDWK